MAAKTKKLEITRIAITDMTASCPFQLAAGGNLSSIWQRFHR